ncbi:MAG: M23 family metallopeptidase, partial [Bacillota bacterium]
AGWQGAYGNVIFIDHGGSELVTVYAHLSRIDVSVGDVVARGDVIGHSGNTGRSTGPHLHFEIRADGTPRNPLNYFPD